MPNGWTDESELLDEHGDVPAIELALNPIADIPIEELTLIGEMMAWTAYIEVDLFLLFILASPGDEIKRWKQFYKQTSGLNQRIRLVRLSFKDKLTSEKAKALDLLMNEVDALAQLRNEWAHNPIIRFGPKRALLRWIVGSGDMAGKLKGVDASVVRPNMPTLRQLHNSLTNLAALIRSPRGEAYAITFGDSDERTEAQVERYLRAVEQSPD